MNPVPFRAYARPLTFLVRTRPTGAAHRRLTAASRAQGPGPLGSLHALSEPYRRLSVLTHAEPTPARSACWSGPLGERTKDRAPGKGGERGALARSCLVGRLRRPQDRAPPLLSAKAARST